MKRILVITASLVFCAVLLHAQDPFKVAAEVYQAVDQLKTAYSDINQVKHIVEQIEKGEQPTVTSNQWTDLAFKYAAAARQIRSAPLPTDFDRTKFEISVSSIDCKTIPDIITKGDGFVEALRQAKQRGDSTIVIIDEAIVVADSTRSALNYLEKVYVKLTQTPIFGQIFQWDWLELNIDVSRSLGEYRSAMGSQKKKINAELDKLKISIANLASNLDLLKSIQCVKNGSYTSDDPLQRFTLVINGESCSWTEKAQGGATITRNVQLIRQNNTIRIERPNDDEVLSFLGYQPALRAEINAKGPQPSFIMLTINGNNLTGVWNGLVVTKDARAHLKELKQPGTSPPKTFNFVKAGS